MSANQEEHVTNDLVADDNSAPDEAQQILDDGDSGYAQSGSNITASLASSIMRFRQENGRTYHSYREGKYGIPNDEIENNRLGLNTPNFSTITNAEKDLQNHLFSLTFGGKLFLAPVNNIQNCLDVGTGTGIWAIDFADDHPEAAVIGVDLSVIQPTWVPPNLSFVIDDLEELWTFSKKFDFIHSRMMVGSFASWENFLGQAMSALEPGGYIELQDVHELNCDDNEDWPNTSLYQWWDLVTKGFNAMGRSMNASGKHKERMIDAGFEDVKEEVFKWPVGMWPKDKKMKELGLWSRENTIDALEGLAIGPLTRQLNWSAEEVKVMCAKARTDIKNQAIHSYFCIHVVYGRKPIAATEA